MKETVRQRVVRFLKGRKTPTSIPQIAEATGCVVTRVREVIMAERKASGSAVFRIGGYAKGGKRRTVGYLLGPGEDAPVVQYGELYRSWTADEENLLRLHTGTTALPELAKLLNRDVRAIRKKLRELGFKRGVTKNVMPRGLEHLKALPLDTVQKQWVGGHIFKLKSNRPGIAGITIHNTARRGDDIGL